MHVNTETFPRLFENVLRTFRFVTELRHCFMVTSQYFNYFTSFIQYFIKNQGVLTFDSYLVFFYHFLGKHSNFRKPRPSVKLGKTEQNNIYNEFISNEIYMLALEQVPFAC